MVGLKIYCLGSIIFLKALDTFGNCQRPVFLLGVFLENNDKKNTLVAQICVLSDALKKVLENFRTEAI